MVCEDQLAKIKCIVVKGSRAASKQKASSSSSLIQPPHSNSSSERPNSRPLAAQAGSKSGLLGSRVQILSPTWRSRNPRSEPHRMPGSSQRHGVRMPLSQDASQPRSEEHICGLSPVSSRAVPDTLPQNFPEWNIPLPVQLSSSRLDLSSLLATSFLSQYQLPLTCPVFPLPFCTVLLCMSSKRLTHLSPFLFSVSSLPFSLSFSF